MEHSGRRSERGSWECQHTAVNGKLSGEYSAVEYNEMRKRSRSVNSKLSMGIKLLVLNWK